MSAGMGSVIRMGVKTGVSSLVCRSGWLSLYRKRRGGRVVILMYHKIAEDEDPLGLTIPPDVFSRQLQLLTRQYSVVSLGEAVRRLESGNVDRDYVVLTFDDGYRNNYTAAYPVLRRHGTPATIFVTHDAVETGTFGWHRFDASIMASPETVLDLTASGLDRYSLRSPEERERTIVELHGKLKTLPEAERLRVVDQVIRDHGDPAAGERIMLTWDEIREMHASGLITIGAHTLTHPILTRVPPETAMKEIAESKRLIEEKLGDPVDFFAYPNGGWDDFSPDIMAMVKSSGYRAACCTVSPEQMKEPSPFALPRTDITRSVSCGPGGAFSPSVFSVKVSGMLDGILFRS